MPPAHREQKPVMPELPREADAFAACLADLENRPNATDPSFINWLTVLMAAGRNMAATGGWTDEAINRDCNQRIQSLMSRVFEGLIMARVRKRTTDTNERTPTHE